MAHHLLEDGVDTEEAVKYLHKLDVFETVDYDYVMKSDGETVDISGNTYAEDLTYLDTMGIKNGWEHNANNNKYPGGSADVVIAVIDTGVDYNHIDLRNNIWVNSAEIPGNGIDDDGNGYVDDVNGWDCVGDDNDPMDDNGHGTHVAGIAAAENNKTGTVGVAYNCKIMCLKAGNSSGYFNNSDIAEAIQYAYMNGASVINMSFGGYSISIAVEDALMDAYNQCVLVAAAGNDGLCNQPGCCLGAAPCYPAALSYVIGVMSCNANGTTKSAFSNFDHNPYNSLSMRFMLVANKSPQRGLTTNTLHSAEPQWHVLLLQALRQCSVLPIPTGKCTPTNISNHRLSTQALRGLGYIRWLTFTRHSLTFPNPT